jgi:hypothetical protein
VCSKNWQEAETVFLFDLRVDGLLTPKLPGLKKKKTRKHNMQPEIFKNRKKSRKKYDFFFIFDMSALSGMRLKFEARGVSRVMKRCRIQ